MRLATIISLGASAVLGLGALVVARFWLPDDGGKKQETALVPVVAAAKPIAFGATLDAQNLTVVRMPPEAVPAGSFRDIKDLVGMEGGAPVALAAIAPREAILPAKLSGAGARPSMAALITPGMRAYAIPVSGVAGGGGHVLPGDHVDVLLARQIPTPTGEPEVEVSVVLQNVRVLGINLNSDQTSVTKASPQHATVEVTVEDAGRLTAAGQIGSLSVALRRAGATDIEPIRPIKTGDVLPFGALRARAAPPPPNFDQPAPAARPAAPVTRTGGLVIVNGTTRSVASDGAGA